MTDLINVINGCDISRDNYSKYIDSCVVVDLNALQNYYDTKIAYANHLVREDEFVGRTYKNLRIIKRFLKK